MALILSALVIATAAPYSLHADDTGAFGGFRVAGYLPDYRFAELEVASLSGLTDLILFSAEPNVDGSLDLKRLENCPWDKLLAFKTQHRVRLFLTIGGWDRSAHFAQVAASNEKRKSFVAAVLRMAMEERLDGIDLDWEHPKDASEQEAYGQLLADLRSAFKPHGIMLTVTIAAWQRLPALAINSVDGVQLMAYDHDREHSTIEGTRKDIQTLLDADIAVGKIVLGLPFYGRDISTRQAKSYSEIVAEFAPDPMIDQIGQMYFNGPDTIRRKVQFAMDSRLGGVMLWELGQDAPGSQSLLKVIQNAVSETNK